MRFKVRLASHLSLEQCREKANSIKDELAVIETMNPF
jgi:hypothetical protein